MNSRINLIAMTFVMLVVQPSFALFCSGVYQGKGPRLSSPFLEPISKTAQGTSAKSTVFVASEGGFLKKLDMIESAKPGTKIRLGYFIFENDFTSSLLVQRLLQKAAIGVQVELLVDYMMTEKYVSWLQFMASHKNVQVRRFRPPTQDFAQLLTVDMQIQEPGLLLHGLAAQNAGMIQKALQSSPLLAGKLNETMALIQQMKVEDGSSEASQIAGMVALQKIAQGLNPQWGARFAKGLDLLTRRMHHKIFMVENTLGLESLVGGRNVSDEYHLPQGHPLLKERNYPFFDNEISFVSSGKAKELMEQSYEDLFNSPFSLPVQNTLSVEQLQAEQTHMNANAKVLEADLGNLRASALNGTLPVKSRSEVVYSENLPKGIVDHQTITENWSQMMAKAKKKVTIISAYFYLFPALRAAVKEAVSRGVEVEIYTNSYTSTDMNMVNVASYMDFASWKKEMGSGFRVFELNKGKGEGSLHAKMIAIDDQVVGIGSANADPRNNSLDSNNMLFLSTNGQEGLFQNIIRAYTQGSGYHRLQWNELTLERSQQLLEERRKDSGKVIQMLSLPGVKNQI